MKLPQHYQLEVSFLAGGHSKDGEGPGEMVSFSVPVDRQKWWDEYKKTSVVELVSVVSSLPRPGSDDGRPRRGRREGRSE